MRIQFNAFHKDSSASYSSTVEVFTHSDFIDAEETFETEIPFSRYNFDHEFLDGRDGDEEKFDKWNMND